MPTLEEVTTFSLIIEQRMSSKGISAIDAVVDYCSEKNLEPEIAGKLVSGVLKSKIAIEAENLHFLPRSNTSKLPF